MELTIEYLLSKEFLTEFGTAIKSRDESFIKKSLAPFKPEDITELLYEFDSEECKYVLELLDPDVATKIIVDLDEDIRAKFLNVYKSNELAKFIDLADSDDGADILNQMPLKRQEEIISKLASEEKAGFLIDLLKYDEDVAGGLMAKELIRCNVNWDVLQCIAEIRKQAENVDKIFSLYVTDDQNNLLGKVSLKKIILSTDSTKVKDIYLDDIISVGTYLEDEEVVKAMQKYGLEAVPVVNPRGKLVGRITIDDIVDLMTELAEEERQLMSGISADVEEDDSVWILSKARLPWLVIGMVGGLMAAQFMQVFEADIALVPAIAFFVPLIMATGGNVGIQSSSIIVQSLASSSTFTYSVWSRLFRVLLVAIINGTVLAILVFGAIYVFSGSEDLGATVAIALVCVVLLASVMGTITPLILDRFGINPALASGPFITTANDLMGLAVYFAIANALLGL